MKKFILVIVAIVFQSHAFGDCDKIHSATLNMPVTTLGTPSELQNNASVKSIFKAGQLAKRGEINPQADDYCILFTTLNNKPGSPMFQVPSDLVTSYAMDNVVVPACESRDEKGKHILWIRIDNEKTSRPWPNFFHDMECFSNSEYSNTLLQNIFGNNLSVILK